MNTEEECAANRSFRELQPRTFSGQRCCPKCPYLAASGSKNYDKILISSPEEKLFPTKSVDQALVPEDSVRSVAIERVHENRNLLGVPVPRISKNTDLQPKSSEDRSSQASPEVGRTQTSTGVVFATMTDSPGTNKMRMSQSGLIYTLYAIREPIVDYQETRGVSRNEEVTFITLITSLCTQAYTAAITILVMLWNLVPLLDGFVYFARFTLDKLIDIIQTEDTKDKAIKAALFVGELTVILFIIFLIMGLIFMPVYVLTARLLGKVWSMIAW